MAEISTKFLQKYLTDLETWAADRLDGDPDRLTQVRPLFGQLSERTMKVPHITHLPPPEDQDEPPIADSQMFPFVAGDPGSGKQADTEWHLIASRTDPRQRLSVGEDAQSDADSSSQSLVGAGSEAGDGSESLECSAVLSTFGHSLEEDPEKIDHADGMQSPLLLPKPPMNDGDPDYEIVTLASSSECCASCGRAGDMETISLPNTNLPSPSGRPPSESTFCKDTHAPIFRQLLRIPDIPDKNTDTDPQTTEEDDWDHVQPNSA